MIKAPLLLIQYFHKSAYLFDYGKFRKQSVRQKKRAKAAEHNPDN
jgi:hypothetical protein